jgi:hypothetical protein
MSAPRPVSRVAPLLSGKAPVVRDEIPILPGFCSLAAASDLISRPGIPLDRRAGDKPGLLASGFEPQPSLGRRVHKVTRGVEFFPDSSGRCVFLGTSPGLRRDGGRSGIGPSAFGTRLPDTVALVRATEMDEPGYVEEEARATRRFARPRGASVGNTPARLSGSPRPC